MSIRETDLVIHWIEIYPVRNSVLHLLSEWSLKQIFVIS